jgi:hypothetical protein
VAAFGAMSVSAAKTREMPSLIDASSTPSSPMIRGTPKLSEAEVPAALA